MDVFFKPILILAVVIIIFGYIFARSNTLETTTEVVISPSGMPTQKTNYIFHWDRFGNYIINTPQRVKKCWQQGL